MNLKFFRLYGLTIVVSLFIMYTCMMPSDNMPNTGWLADFLHLPMCIRENIDKVVHFVYFMILSLAAGSDFYRQRTDYGTKKMFMVTLLYPALLGALIEVMQEYLTTTRSGDIIDLLFDIFGAIVGYFIGKILIPKVVKREMVGLK